MNFLISLMGALIGIILAVAIIIFIIYWKIRKSLGKGQVQELKNAISNISNYQREEYSREKSIKGLTTLLEPLILEDFTDFNKELMFSICEICEIF